MGASCSIKSTPPLEEKRGYVPPISKQHWTEQELNALGEPTNWAHYTDPAWGFTFEYPSNWELRTDQGNKYDNYQITVRTGHKHDPKRHIYCSAEISIIIDDLRRTLTTPRKKGPVTLEEYIVPLAIQGKVGIIEREGISLSERKAYRTTLQPEKQVDGTQTRLESVVVMSDTGQYAFTFNFFVSDVDAYYEKFKTVADRMKHSLVIDFTRQGPLEDAPKSQRGDTR